MQSVIGRGCPQCSCAGGACGAWRSGRLFGLGLPGAVGRVDVSANGLFTDQLADCFAKAAILAPLGDGQQEGLIFGRGQQANPLGVILWHTHSSWLLSLQENDTLI